jgi:hypothetical protein
MSEGFVLRVAISDTDIRKMKVAEKPVSLIELENVLKEQLKITFPFITMYEDKDFGNALCTLSSMDEIQSFSTIRLMEIVSQASSTSALSEMVSASTSDNDGHLRKSGGWPTEFIIPKFDHDIEFMLSNADSEYRDAGKLMILTKSAKGAILQKLVTTIYDIKVYPVEAEFTAVAKALTTKFPCLRETGSKTGYDGWRNSLQFKMGNYRTEVRKAGGVEVAVNGGRRSRYQPELPGPRKAIKKPRRSESNFLPNFPQGEDSSAQQEMQALLQEEYKKVDADTNVIHNLMAKTFALRRQIIVKDCPRMSTMLQQWPAMFSETEVSFSFCCIYLFISLQ